MKILNLYNLRKWECFDNDVWPSSSDVFQKEGIMQSGMG